MANNFSSLIQPAFEAVNEISRELTGMVSAVTKSIEAQRVSVDQQIRVPVVGDMVVDDLVPSNISSTGRDIPVTEVPVNITRQKKVSFHVTGEQVAGTSYSGTYKDLFRQSVTEALRKIVNAIELDLCSLYIHASRTYGQVTNSPFGTDGNLSDLSQTRRLLDDVGTPMMGRSLVMNTDAGASLRGHQSSVFKVDESGSMAGREAGVIGRLFNFDMRESGQVPVHGAAGTVAGTLEVDHAAGYPAGTTEITVSGPTSGDSLNAGDIVTFAGHTVKYVVARSVADGFTTITLAKPGLAQAVANDEDIKIQATSGYRPSIALSKDAILCAMRPPKLPDGGDVAQDRMTVMDSQSSVVVDLVEYKQYLQSSFELQCCWGYSVIRPEHMHLLIGKP